MKYSLIALAALGLVSTSQAITIQSNIPADVTNVQLGDPCLEPLELSAYQLNVELDYFSRSFDIVNYNNANKIHDSLLKTTGKDYPMSVHTWELYDTAFAFPRVRRYDLVQQGMDLLQHFEDNLNQNFSNSLHVSNFIEVAKKVQSQFNEKYHDGEFGDPAGFDPEAEHPVTWATATV